MNHIKKYNESKEISSMGTLSNSDVEIISDLLLEFSEKWSIPILINERGWGNHISIQRYSSSHIQISIRYNMLDEKRENELEANINSIDNRIKKFGYKVVLIKVHNIKNIIGYEYIFMITPNKSKLKKILTLDESINYNKYHTISDEDIMDICLEMTDIQFESDIKKYFINEDGSKTKEPLTKISYPIYDIEFEISRESSDSTRWNGSYFYEDINVISSFHSVLNKMKKILPVEDALYYISNMKYNIRLILSPINLSVDEVGFDFNRFINKLDGLLSSMERNNHLIEIVDQYGNNNSFNFEIFTDGIYKSDDYKDEIWKNNDVFDNTDQYQEIVDRIEKFLLKFNKHIKYEFSIEKNRPYKKEVKSGFLKKTIKTYNRYSLVCSIKSK